MSVDAADASSRFDIGRVIQQTFAVLSRNIVTFGLLAFILVGIPTGIVAYFQFEMLKQVLPGIREGNFNLSPGAFAASGLGGIATLIATAILQGALIHATVQDLNGQPQSMGDSLATGLRNFLSLIVVQILFALALFCGFLLLIVPGVMIACAWCVAAPSLVADRTGIFGAFSRSADLTRGNRWQIFGLLVIVVVVVWIISAIFNALTGMSSIGMSRDPFAVIDRVLSPLTIVYAVLRATIGSVIGATALSVMYVELRRAREGGGGQWLADIFN